MVTDKYLYKTNQGYDILGTYFVPNSERGFGPDSSTFVVVKRKTDFVVGKDYNFAEGWWAGGQYGFKTEAEARKYVTGYVDRKGYWIHPQVLMYVVDKGNRNQLDNYGIYTNSERAFEKARRIAMDRHTSEIKLANGRVWAVLTEVQDNVVTAYFPQDRTSAVVNKDGSYRPPNALIDPVRGHKNF